MNIIIVIIFFILLVFFLKKKRGKVIYKVDEINRQYITYSSGSTTLTRIVMSDVLCSVREDRFIVMEELKKDLYTNGLSVLTEQGILGITDYMVEFGKETDQIFQYANLWTSRHNEFGIYINVTTSAMRKDIEDSMERHQKEFEICLNTVGNYELDLMKKRGEKILKS